MLTSSCLVEPGRLLEDDVLACPRRGHRLRGMEVVRRRDGDDVDVRRLEQILVPRRQPRVRQGKVVLLERGPRPRESRPWSHVTRTCGFFWKAAMC